MTHKKDLKKLVRERQHATGERYTTALAQVREQGREREGAPRVREVATYDATALARAEGFAGPLEVEVSASLWRCESEPAAREQALGGVLRALARLLKETRQDAALQRLRGVLLEGERDGMLDELARGRYRYLEGLGALSVFLERLGVGLRGPGLGGRAVALDVGMGSSGVRSIVACLLPRFRAQAPRLLLSLAEDWLKLGSPPRLLVPFGDGSLTTRVQAGRLR